MAGRIFANHVYDDKVLNTTDGYMCDRLQFTSVTIMMQQIVLHDKHSKVAAWSFRIVRIYVWTCLLPSSNSLLSDSFLFLFFFFSLPFLSSSLLPPSLGEKGKRETLENVWNPVPIDNSRCLALYTSNGAMKYSLEPCPKSH